MADNSNSSFLDKVRGLPEMATNQVKHDYTQVMQNRADREAIIARENKSNALTSSQKEQLSYISNAADAQKFVDASMLGNENGDYTAGQNVYKESLKSSAGAWGGLAANAAELYVGGALTKGIFSAGSKIFGSLSKGSRVAERIEPTMGKAFESEFSAAQKIKREQEAIQKAQADGGYWKNKIGKGTTTNTERAGQTVNQERRAAQEAEELRADQSRNPFNNRMPRETTESSSGSKGIFGSILSGTWGATKFAAKSILGTGLGLTALGGGLGYLGYKNKDYLQGKASEMGTDLINKNVPDYLQEPATKILNDAIYGEKKEGGEEGTNDGETGSGGEGKERGPNLIEKIGAGLVGAGVATGSNPFKGIKGLVGGVGSLFPSRNSSEAMLSSMPSGGDSGTVGEGHFAEGGLAGNTVLEVLNKIYQVLSSTRNITEDMARNVSALVRAQSQQDTSRDLMSSNLSARQNEGGSASILSSGGGGRDDDNDNSSSSKKEGGGILNSLMSAAGKAGDFAKKWKYPIAVAGGVTASMFFGKEANASEATSDFKQMPKTLTPIKGKLSSESKQGGLSTKEFDERVIYAKKFFLEAGWSEAQASGIIGNLIGESGLQSAPKPGDGGTSYGIAQWHSPERQAKFKEIMKVSINDATFGQQLQFVDWELKNSEQKAGNLLKSQKTVSGATGVFEKYFERDKQSSGPNGKISKIRIQSAENVMQAKSPSLESNSTDMTPEEIEHRRRGANIDEIKETPQETSDREQAWSKYDNEEPTNKEKGLLDKFTDTFDFAPKQTATPLDAEVSEVDTQKAVLQEERNKLAKLSPSNEKDMTAQLDRLNDINTEMVALNKRRNDVTGSAEYQANMENRKTAGMQQASMKQQQPSMSQQLQGPRSPAGVSKAVPKVRNDDPTLMKVEQGNLWNTNSHNA
jgi:hypothetical protein